MGLFNVMAGGMGFSNVMYYCLKFFSPMGLCAGKGLNVRPGLARQIVRYRCIRPI